MSMAGVLPENFQVRKERWGLLFYSAARHKVCFVRSGDWLLPDYFDGSWSLDSLVKDVATRTRNPGEVVERSLGKLISHLKENGMIINTF